MSDLSCPHCTFINPISKVKCGMCLRYLRKRERVEDVADLQAPLLETRDRGTHEVNSTDVQDQSTGKCVQDTTAASSTTDTAVPERGKIAEQPEDTVATSLHRAAESSTSAVVDPPAIDSAPTNAVRTLFSTAAGSPVNVRRESLHKAMEKLRLSENDEDHGTPSNATVSTLFSTAAGRPVKVSAKALEAAKAKLQSDALLDEGSEPLVPQSEESTTSAPVESSRPVEAKPSGGDVREPTSKESRSSTMESTASPAAPRPSPLESESVATPRGVGLGMQRRRGFVPPQRIASVTAVSHRATQPSSRAAPPPRLHALRLNAALCESRVISPLPSLSTILSDQFQFRYADCGDLLARLFGVHDGQYLTVERWKAALERLGASGVHCTLEWCSHILRSSIIKARRLHSVAQQSANVFTVLSVLLCCVQKYNQEIVEGERPALRKMVEGDVPSASFVILYISSLRDEQTAPHTRVVTLCDGFYHLKATCDVPLSNLLREKVLMPGQRIALCGAKSLLHSHCTPVECQSQLAFSINYNCVRSVAEDTPLGLCRCEPPPLPLSLVHPLGGLVPALDGIVARILPPFYVAQQTSENNAAIPSRSEALRDGNVKVVRNHHAQLQQCDQLRRDWGDRANSMAATPTVECGIQWPSNLLQMVRRHLDQVEDATMPSIPPMPSTAMSIFTFFESYRDQLHHQMMRDGFDPHATTCCIAFIIGVLEQSCSLSFLLPRERRIVATTVRQVEKRWASKTREEAPELKRRRPEEKAMEEPRYARVLTLEYLLRLYVSLPMILQHYDKLGGIEMPAYFTYPLWHFINLTLALLNQYSKLFSPISTYVALR